MKQSAINSYNDLQALFPAENSFSYRPIIVWAMNDTLCKDELKQQITSFKASGYGGIMVMPWGGLPYDFMSNDWLEAVNYILQRASELDIDIWIWDDWLFGSGPAAGQLTKDPQYRAKALRVLMDIVIEPQESLSFIAPPRAVSACVFNINKFANPIAGSSFETIKLNTQNQITIHAETRKRLVIVGWECISGMQHTTTSHAMFLDQNITEQECDIYICEDPHVSSVDMLNPQAIANYVKLIHQRYYDAMPQFFGNTLKGFFYDEPKASTNMPWTQDFAERFERIKGYDITPYLPSIFLVYSQDGGDFTDKLRPQEIKKAEADYRDVWSTLLAQTFYGTIQSWCSQHNVIATGHPIGDNSLHEAFSNGGYYFKNMGFSDMPGVDTVGGFNQIVPGAFHDFPRLPGSRATVLGKPRAMSESFAVYGHGLDLDHMRYTCEHQIIRGVNTFFCKLSNYNREKSFYFHPPELSEYNPIIEHYGPAFCQRINNIASLMNSGTDLTPRIALYVATSNYYYRDPDIAEQITRIAENLTYNQLEFDYLWDNDILDLHEKDDAVANSHGQSYSHIVLPPNIITPPPISQKLESLNKTVNLCDLDEMTIQQLISQYREQPNHILKSISANARVSIRTRALDQGIHCCMLLNESDSTQRLTAEFTRKTNVLELDLDTWKVVFLTESEPAAPVELDFIPAQSRILICDTNNTFTLPPQKEPDPTEDIPLQEWSIETPDGKTIHLGTTLPDWQQLGWPGFTGFMRYRCQFTCNKEHRNALLSLGELRYAATVLLDNNKVGDCVFTPFTVHLDNLTPGEHPLEINVLNTPANAIFGDTKKLKSLRSARVFEGTYAPLYEKLDLTKLPSGLLGPVRLHY